MSGSVNGAPEELVRVLKRPTGRAPAQRESGEHRHDERQRSLEAVWRLIVTGKDNRSGGT